MEAYKNIVLAVLVMVCFTWEANHPNDGVAHYQLYKTYVDLGGTVRLYDEIGGEVPGPALPYSWPETRVEHCIDLTRQDLIDYGFVVTASDSYGRESDYSNIADCKTDQSCIDKYLKPGQVTGIHKVTGIHLEPDGH